MEPRKTREAVCKHIRSVQLPELLREVDAAAHFSEALLARRPSSSNELLAVYGALLAHGIDLDVKGEIGAPVLLVNHIHLDVAGPYRASHAIFIAEGVATIQERRE